MFPGGEQVSLGAKRRQKRLPSLTWLVQNLTFWELSGKVSGVVVRGGKVGDGK